jgi:hypothetical protein
VSTNQTMLTIGAFLLLLTILVSFYKLLAESGDTIWRAQGDITEITLATTYMELAQGLSFDEASIDSNLTPSEINYLTAPAYLGPENPPPTGEPTENSFRTFDDFDDLKNYEIVDSAVQGILGTYKTKFNVYYVNPLNIDQVSSSRTFVKRLDMTTWRIKPPSPDTLKTSLIMGYFHFD